jgi:hypothetical protein
MIIYTSLARIKSRVAAACVWLKQEISDTKDAISMEIMRLLLIIRYPTREK